MLTRLPMVYLDKPMVVKRRVVCRTLSTPTLDGSVTATAHNAVAPDLFLKRYVMYANGRSNPTVYSGQYGVVLLRPGSRFAGDVGSTER